METTGQHIIAELTGCLFLHLFDTEYTIIGLMREAAETSGATVLNITAHKFSPNGITCVIAVSESHFSIHTWPEKKYAAVDAYTCGDCQPMIGIQKIVDALKPERTEYIMITRGIPEPLITRITR